MHIETLGNLATDALSLDRVLGYTRNMPDPYDGDDYRACQAGPCEVATLFVDALQWYAQTDVAFMTSGGVRDGWPAGPVKVQNLWRGLPFPNTLCTGVMSGISLYRVLEYSTRVASFDDVREADLASNLLQVAGLRVEYQQSLGFNVSKVVSVDVYNRTTELYEPLDRLKLYSFATDSYVCGVAEPFPTLLGPSLIIQGEVPAQIVDTTHQRIVEEFLTANHITATTPYEAVLDGPMVNIVSSSSTTNETDILNLIESANSCEPRSQYWAIELQSCLDCPVATNVQWLRDELEYEGISGSVKTQSSTIALINGASFPVTLSPKANPSWLKLLRMVKQQHEEKHQDHITSEASGADSLRGENTTSGATLQQQQEDKLVLAPGQHMLLDYTVSAEYLEPGTALGTVSFAVTDGGDFPACGGAGKFASFDVIYRVTPAEELNHLGNYRWIGWSFAIIVAMTSIGGAIWVVCNSHQVRTESRKLNTMVMLPVGSVLQDLTEGNLPRECRAPDKSVLSSQSILNSCVVFLFV